MNVLKICSDVFVLLGNCIYRVIFRGNVGELEFIKEIELSFTEEYLYMIERFPWADTISRVLKQHEKFPNVDLDTLSEIAVATQLSKMTSEWKENLYSADMENWRFTFSRFVSCTVTRSLICQYEILGNEKYASAFKKWCVPCDSGINYYNGEWSCYIYLDDKFQVQYEKKYYFGCATSAYRHGIHYGPNTQRSNYAFYVHLFDIFKSYEQNKTEMPVIPMYDLGLYRSNITGILGISAGVQDVLERQVGIYTKRLKFTD